MSMGSSLRSLAPRLRNSVAYSRTCKRSLHQRTPTPFSENDALQPFLSAEGVRTVAVEYQQGLLDRLNDSVKGTEHESSSVYKTVINTAGVRSQVLTFNYACQALNNAFFLSRLTAKPEEVTTAKHPSLTRHADASFGSMTGLKATFSSAAMGMFGNGWIWLVTNRRGLLGVVPTYGAGTVLVQHRQERVNLKSLIKTENKQQEGEEESEDVASKEKSNFGPPVNYQKLNDVMYGTNTSQTHHVFPLLALSVHEHAWIKDYGIWGKEDYVRNFWDVVDWTKVEQTIQGYQLSA